MAHIPHNVRSIARQAYRTFLTRGAARSTVGKFTATVDVETDQVIVLHDIGLGDIKPSFRVPVAASWSN